MGINIKKEDFETTVIKGSEIRPVLVDFWAPWCNPCKVLGPILEKLEKDFSERFLLAKINTEEEQELATLFNISSIPFVALFVKGKIKDTFLGALNESMIKNFLDKNLPHQSIEEIETLIKNSLYDDAGEKIIQQNLKGEDIDEYLWKIFKYKLQNKSDIYEIKKFIDHISDYGSKYSEFKNILKSFYKFTITEDELNQILNLANDSLKSESLEYFLKKIEESSGEKKEQFKNCLFVCFLILDKDPIVLDYRKKLSRILF